MVPIKVILQVGIMEEVLVHGIMGMTNLQVEVAEPLI